MDPITTLDSSYEFIELNRTFHELSRDSSENDDVDISRAFGVGERLRWPNLIKIYRLIILSEAGSGKTAEIRNIARVLREQGKHAFFLRLEHIPRDFEDAFEVGTCETFEEWLASSEEGWLLLDSVDEARLRNPGDFELAILYTDLFNLFGYNSPPLAAKKWYVCVCPKANTYTNHITYR